MGTAQLLAAIRLSEPMPSSKCFPETFSKCGRCCFGSHSAVLTCTYAPADGSIGVVAADEGVTGAELLSVSQPLAFLEGTMGSPPSVEDLHVAMLESDFGPAVSKVLSYLPRKPSPAAAAKGDAAGSSSEPEQQQQQQVDPNAQDLPPSMMHLQPAFWGQVQQGAGGLVANKVGSKQLMRLLQASCWSEEFQDPAAAQVGFVVCLVCGWLAVWLFSSMVLYFSHAD
jgi:hypothetical protein